MDVVKVENGDQITGDVERLERGELSFSTAAAGTIDITWSQVVTLSSKQILDVDTSSGMRYTGTISSPADGQLVVQTATGPTHADAAVGHRPHQIGRRDLLRAHVRRRGLRPDAHQ